PEIVRQENTPQLLNVPFAIPTLKSGPSETMRLKRSVVSGPRLRRGKSACRTSLLHGLLNHSSFRRARMRLESFRAPEPDGDFDEWPRRGAVVDAEPGAHAQERVDGEPAGRA